MQGADAAKAAGVDRSNLQAGSDMVKGVRNPRRNPDFTWYVSGYAPDRGQPDLLTRIVASNMGPSSLNRKRADIRQSLRRGLIPSSPIFLNLINLARFDKAKRTAISQD
jgi:hypothetical protein